MVLEQKVSGRNRPSEHVLLFRSGKGTRLLLANESTLKLNALSSLSLTRPKSRSIVMLQSAELQTIFHPFQPSYTTFLVDTSISKVYVYGGGPGIFNSATQTLQIIGPNGQAVRPSDHSFS